jgi:hypothetical protein
VDHGWILDSEMGTKVIHWSDKQEASELTHVSFLHMLKVSRTNLVASQTHNTQPIHISSLLTIYSIRFQNIRHFRFVKQTYLDIF